MNFALALLLFVTTGCPTPDLVATDVPTAESTPANPAEPPPPPFERVPPKPPAPPAAKTCGPPPNYACGGAIGFCPEWVCVDGRWVDGRPKKRSRPTDPIDAP